MLSWPDRHSKEEAERSVVYHCEIGENEGMPNGRTGAVMRSEVSYPEWFYELDGAPSPYSYSSPEEALEELRRKLDSREQYVPSNCPSRCPMLISFHGAGREGESEISRWEEIAEKEKILLLAPTSCSEDRFWGKHPSDLETVKKTLDIAIDTWPVDRSRIYLAGHSAGGHFALNLAFNNAALFAAIAAHSPWMSTYFLSFPFPTGARRIPVGVWVGDDDGNRLGAEMLQRGLRELHRFSIVLKILQNHRHIDYHKRRMLPDEMWEFLKQHSAPARENA